jgi:hypothetical protein|tara:strand:- start:311 stop:448 length:138 start_codon:yes stop_codon:yes gene_type:complete
MERQKIWFNCEKKLLKKFTAYCKFKGLIRNKVLERIVREFTEAQE